MDPASATALSTVALGTSAGGGVLGAFGSLMSGDANADAYKYKAGLALMNQRINKQNASWALEAGETNAMESGLKSRQEIGSTKVHQAGSGFDVNSGTASEVRDTQGKTAEFDENMIRYDASKTAYGYEAKAAADEAESHMDLAAADNASKAGKINAFSSILGAASSVSSKWLQGSQIWGGASGSIGTFDPDNYGKAPNWSRAT